MYHADQSVRTIESVVSSTKRVTRKEGRGKGARTKSKDEDTMGYPFFLCTLFLRIKHDTEVDHNELKEKKKECKKSVSKSPAQFLVSC